ncbi:MAG TPA: hypothetical protein VGG35_12520 [Streptosporangiaceae bacterium]
MAVPHTSFDSARPPPRVRRTWPSSSRRIVRALERISHRCIPDSMSPAGEAWPPGGRLRG